MSSGAKKVVSTDLLISLFNQLFFEPYNTRLEGGADEPIYLPANCLPASSSPANNLLASSLPTNNLLVNREHDYHRLIFRSDYVSSAFHEISHWCIAGEERRQLEDFGYWYNPDGRTAEQQRTFENVEVKPQALEWIFSVAANHTFNISADNLAGDIGASDHFVQSVIHQARAWCVSPLPERPALLVAGLSEIFGTSPLEQSHYALPGYEFNANLELNTSFEMNTNLVGCR